MEAQHQQQWVMSAQAQTHQHPSTMATSSVPYHQPTTLEEVRTLWIGDLQIWVDEAYLHNCFSHTGEVPPAFYTLDKLIYAFLSFFKALF